MSSSYPGSELELFQHAVNCKTYYASQLRGVIRGDTLEVGAGIGGTCRFLCDGTQRSWTCLEPDGKLLDQLRASLAATPLPVRSHIRLGTAADLEPAEQFDTVLYIDVLEHIEDDRGELERCARHVRPGGSSSCSARRTTGCSAPSIARSVTIAAIRPPRAKHITPTGLSLSTTYYLDSVGMLASLANRLLLKSAMPTATQIRFWDSTLVRASRVLDPLTVRRIGKSVVAVWTKAPAVSG